MTATRSAQQEALLEKIRRHLQYLDIEYGFTTRLARENGWNPDFARQVVDEYAKFLFLAREGGHPVSPPPTIDQAWHLHLVHTESYWGDFCPNILQMQLHHSPATGTHGESARFADWSGQTLASYRKFFGPPPSFWLDSPRPLAKSPSSLLNTALIAAGVGVILALAGLCSGVAIFAGIGLVLVVGSVFSAAVTELQANAVRARKAGPHAGTCGGSSCSTAAGGSDTASTPGAHGSHSGHSCSSGHGGGGHSCGGGGGHGCGGGSSCGGGGH